MKYLLSILPFVALASSIPSHPQIIPYVLNPGGIGGIYKGPDSETIIKGPDGSVITSEQIGGSVEIDHGAGPVVLNPRPILNTVPLGPSIVHSGPVSDGLLLSTAAVKASAGIISAGGASAGSIVAGPVSAGSISTGPALGPPLINDGLISTVPIHSNGLLSSPGIVSAGGVSAGVVSAGGASAGSIIAGPTSPGVISTGPVLGPKVVSGPSNLLAPSLVNTGPALFDRPVGNPIVVTEPRVVLSQAPIVVDDVSDPKIVHEQVIVGHKVISVPKKVEEDRDLIGPSGTISTRGDDAVISGPSSITVKGDGVVSDIAKQPDIHVKAVEVKPIVPVLKAAPALVLDQEPVVLNRRPLLVNPAPVVEGHGNIITEARPLLRKPGLSPLVPLDLPLIKNPLPIIPGSLDLQQHYAPAYVL